LLYALSAVAFFTLTGVPPFGRGSIESIVARQTLGHVPDVKAFRDDVPDSLLDVLTKGAARSPGERFASAAEYAAALYRSLQPWWARPLAALRASLPGTER
ncbi:MAG: hypothetical protein HYT81_13435, partial [Gemmatimonadetes bacterium]|nr:hypothetical protein [Gemmatimonadota bacterium]